MIGSSLYWRQINLFRRFFPDEQIHVCFFEDLIRDAETTQRDCLRFLSVDANLVTSGSSRRLNPSDVKREPRRLYEVMSRIPGIKRLARRLPNRLRFKKAEKPVWTRKTHDYVTSMLNDDAAQFLSYCGRPSSFWNLDDVQLH